MTPNTPAIIPTTRMLLFFSELTAIADDALCSPGGVNGSPHHAQNSDSSETIDPQFGQLATAMTTPPYSGFGPVFDSLWPLR